ncbi:MAG: alpha-1,2-fucosyltransferase [Erythrobacter sp.]|jgi:hypothetical protein|nr:alpha-1,2-fucosyltransferase [Erythrobacter sp.]
MIVAEAPGQLGNQLILFSHLIAFAKEHGCIVINPSFSQYRHAFEGPSRGRFVRYPAASRAGAPRRQTPGHTIALALSNLVLRIARRALPPENAILPRIECIGHSPEFDIDLNATPNIETIARSRMVALLGWRYRNYDLRTKHDKEVREYLALRPRPEIDRFIAELRRAKSILVGVHVRRGDYRNYENGKYFYSLNQYEHVVRSFIEKFGDREIQVVLFSNESIDVERFAGVDASAGPGDAMDDLYAMTMMDYLVAPPSTFSRWASYAGEVPLWVMENAEPVPTLTGIAPAKW